MFTSKLKALSHPYPESFDYRDEVEYRRLVIWLEDQKIRRYRIKDREGLRNIFSDNWEYAFESYQRELDVPSTMRSPAEILNWLLIYAVRLDYEDKMQIFRSAMDESHNVSKSLQDYSDDFSSQTDLESVSATTDHETSNNNFRDKATDTPISETPTLQQGQKEFSHQEPNNIPKHQNSLNPNITIQNVQAVVPEGNPKGPASGDLGTPAAAPVLLPKLHSSWYTVKSVIAPRSKNKEGVTKTKRKSAKQRRRALLRLAALEAQTSAQHLSAKTATSHCISQGVSETQPSVQPPTSAVAANSLEGLSKKQRKALRKAASQAQNLALETGPRQAVSKTSSMTANSVVTAYSKLCFDGLSKKQRKKLRRKATSVAPSSGVPTTSVIAVPETPILTEPLITSIKASPSEVKKSGLVPTNSGIKRRLITDSNSSGDLPKKTCPETRIRPNPRFDQSDLVVAVTSQIFSSDDARMVKTALHDKLFKMSCDPKNTFGPLFQGKPLISEGALKLWCKDEKTLDWLKEAVDEISLSTGKTFIVGRQKDIPRRIVCGLMVPGTYKELEPVVCLLRMQNEWADIDRWQMHNKIVHDNGMTFVICSVPEDIARAIAERDRRLAFSMGTIYVKFRSRGKFSDVLPLSSQYQSSNLGTTVDSQEPLAGPSSTGPINSNPGESVCEWASKLNEITTESTQIFEHGVSEAP